MNNKVLQQDAALMWVKEKNPKKEKKRKKRNKTPENLDH